MEKKEKIMLNLKKSLESFTLSEDTRRKILNENHPFGNQGTPFIPSEFKEIAQIALAGHFHDFIIAAAGVRPEIRFLEHCSVETGRAVTVDQYLSTSVPGVYGAGDLCGLSGIWPNAMKQGAVAAKNMYGIPTPYEDTYAMKNTMNFFGLPALCIGDINRLDSHTLVITEEDSKNYRKALVEDGVLKSILMVGNISGSGIYQYLIKNQIKLPSADRSIFRLSFADFYGFDTSKGSYTWDTDLCCG